MSIDRLTAACGLPLDARSADDPVETLVDWFLREGREASEAGCTRAASGAVALHYGRSPFPDDDGRDQTTTDLARLALAPALACGVVAPADVSALGPGKVYRKTVSTLLHALDGRPASLSDSAIRARLLHSRATSQKSYTIALCERHQAAWAAGPPTWCAAPACCARPRVECASVLHSALR